MRTRYFYRTFIISLSLSSCAFNFWYFYGSLACFYGSFYSEIMEPFLAGPYANSLIYDVINVAYFLTSSRKFQIAARSGIFFRLHTICSRIFLREYSFYSELYPYYHSITKTLNTCNSVFCTIFYQAYKIHETYGAAPYVSCICTPNLGFF